MKALHNFGVDLVLFRTESGKAVGTDPYCPHLGAHLGYGGQIEGETIRCPFHHWNSTVAAAASACPLPGTRAGEAQNLADRRT